MIRLVVVAGGLLLAAGCAPRAVPRPAPAAPILLIPPPATIATTIVRKPPVADGVQRCPTLAEIRRLRGARPKPLRSQPMPASPAERVARTAAQLGLYEARGAWADQVADMLDRCAAN